MSPSKNKFDPKVISAACISVVESTLQRMGKVEFSQPPVFSEKSIIEYNGKMRVSAMEKFNGPAFVSVITFYLSEKNMQQKRACGNFVVYLEEGNSSKLLKSIGYKGFNEDDEPSALGICGEFCQVLVENFKNEIAQQGFPDLTVSKPSNYHNSVPDGIDFDYDEYIKYETIFELWKAKTMAIDITLAPLPPK